MRNRDELPMADAGREQSAREMFPFAVSPEEYAAREGHMWLCFSFDDYRYSDPDVERWVHRLGDILFRRDGAPSLDDLRAHYLSEEERRQIQSEIERTASDF
jgi:hypothetical protein